MDRAARNELWAALGAGFGALSAAVAVVALVNPDLLKIRPDARPKVAEAGIRPVQADPFSTAPIDLPVTGVQAVTRGGEQAGGRAVAGGAASPAPDPRVPVGGYLGGTIFSTAALLEPKGYREGADEPSIGLLARMGMSGRLFSPSDERFDLNDGRADGARREPNGPRAIGQAV